MKFINNGNSFLLSAPASIFAAEIKNQLKRHTMFNGEKKQIIQSKRLADALFILWAGGAALLSYSLVYALRKPFTAAGFDGLDFFGMDCKTATSIVQISGYFISKLIGIKVISELKKENRLKFIILSVAVAELSLVLFGALPRPLNVFALFFNGLSLGCMWGVIFSFLEGRRVTDLLASLMGLSIAISSGTAKSVGLFVMEHLHISEFWMPAFIGAFAFPLLSSWAFAKVDAVVTLIILLLFGLMSAVRSNIKVLCLLLVLVTCGTATLGFVAFNYDGLQLPPMTWLFLQSLSLYTVYLSFQTLFFERFIACFRIKGNVGFFIVTLDFIGYTGTVVVLVFKEFFNPDINWLDFYNLMSGYVGIVCSVAFLCSAVYLVQRYRKENASGPLGSSLFRLRRWSRPGNSLLLETE